MRRFVYWVLPAVTAIVAAILFASGFYSFLRGDIGTPLDVLAQKPAPLASSSQSLLSPIILGDSVARGTGDSSGLGIGGRLDQELKRRKLGANRTINVAVNGARTADLLRQLDSTNVRTILGQSNVVIISIGGNDLWRGNDWRNAPPENPDAVMNGVLDRIGSVVSGVQSASPRARIFLIGLYNPFAATPAGGELTKLVNRWNARLMEKFGDDVNVTVVQTSDLFATRDRLSFDRFHPGDEGYALIARRLADAL